MHPMLLQFIIFRAFASFLYYVFMLGIIVAVIVTLFWR